MEDLSVIYTATYHQQVYTAKSFLENEGIETFVKDDLSSQVVGYLTAVGGIKLMVRGSDAPRALELLTAGGYIEAGR
jgi:hypothetical protein